MQHSKKIIKKDLIKASSDIGLTTAQAEQIWDHLPSHRQFSLINVLYYLGSLVILYALINLARYGYNSFGAHGLFYISTIYASLFFFFGAYFWKIKKRHTVGGLSIYISLSLVPIITYSIQEIIGWWPGQFPGNYSSFYTFIHGGWLTIETATLLISGVALYYFRFPFLTSVIYLTLWFATLDISPLVFKTIKVSSELDAYEWSSMAYGLAVLATTRCIDRKTQKDYAFWGYFFGLLAFWTGVTFIGYETEWGNFVYCMMNIALIILGPILNRKVFVVFGAFGVVEYLGLLAYRHFAQSPRLAILLTLIGGSAIVIALLIQRSKKKCQRSR